MKKILILTVALYTVFLSSCGKGTPQNPEQVLQAKQKPIMVMAPVANSITEFSFDFFKTLQKDPKVQGNIFVSPLSLHMALGMLANGATDETQIEIMKGLNAENISIADLNDSYKKLMDELPKADPKVNLGLANSIWYKNGFAVEQDFINAMKHYFSAEITGLPFQQSDVKIINKWASDKTNEKIKEVLKEISAEAVMFIMNALYFKGDWTTQFDKKNTRDENFTQENGVTKAVKMMNQTSKFDYASMPDFDALQMPYGNQQFRATILLPKNGKTLAQVFDDLSYTKWNSLQASFTGGEVIVGLPKFTLQQEFMLNYTLEKMGMARIFTRAAQLRGINKQASLIVSFVKQNTFAAVDEVGTEAAAVTTIGIELTSSGPQMRQFICNRPFAFIISEKTSNTILFMGRMMSPDGQ